MQNNHVFALSMAGLWCVVFGSATHDWTLGICLGLCMGVAFGLFGSGEEKETTKEEKENDRF